MITQERLKELLNYNPETGIFIRKIARTGAAKKGSIAGYTQNKGYIAIRVDGKPQQAHRLAWLYCYGSFPEDQIDHINQNKSDNRISNLRVVTSRENNLNQSLRCTNKSGFMGVHWDKQNEKWHAQIRADGKKIHLGFFTKKEDAIKARKEANIKYGYHKNHGNSKV